MTCDSGSPPIAAKIPVGKFVGENESKSSKITKKNAAIDVLEEGKKLPTLSPAKKVKPRARKKAGFTRKRRVKEI